MTQNGTDKDGSHGGGAHSADRRGAFRHAHAEKITLMTQWGAHAGGLLDLSTSGAQVRMADGLVPVDGDDVTVRLLDGWHIAGSVAWIGHDTIGIVFDRPLEAIEDLIWLEQRGPEWFHASVRSAR